MAIELNEKNFDEEIISDKPVLVEFWAAWCGPCRAQAPILEKLDTDKVKVCKVNVDENPGLSQRFEIVSIPTMIVFKDGKIQEKALGLRNLSQLNQLIGI